MAITPSGLFAPRFGALFIAAEDTNPLATLASFTLTGAPTGWTHWGHLSRETLPRASSGSGKYITVTDFTGRRVVPIPADSADSVTYKAAQVDAATIGGLAALNGLRVAALELWVNGARSFAVWYPSVVALLTDRPSASAPNRYAEHALTLAIDTPVNTNLAALVNLAEGIAPWPSTAAPDSLYIDTSAFAG